MSAPTIKDISRETGLSSATISKYINGGNVRPANREAIQKAIKKLGFHPNEAARIIRGVSRRTTAIVIPSISTYYCRELFLSAQRSLVNWNYASILIHYNNDAYHENKAVSTALNNNVDGFISISMNLNAECYMRAKDSDIPVVFVHAVGSKNFHNILLNDHDAVRDIATEICRCGHRRIGIISSVTEHHIADRHIEILMEQFAELDCPLSDQFIYTSSLSNIRAGYEGLEHLISLDDPPTAIMALSSEMLLGAKLAALEHGLRIPEDISLAGAVDSSLSDHPSLRSLTRMCYPITEIAGEAVSIIMKSLDSKRRSVPVELLTSTHNAAVLWGSSIGPRKS